ncbi:hypothetical protein P154DRAFT_539849 [Amniculicola lignicola CBS 123094]|uniref:Uncharacterized protein n=1 Tax=Amniculicola lignicola CBS 123094 TaxID=1392246 RepID=A0A6A5VZJ0_9PLEO|nr:hypothetical protein P154DRAFT_539849 [Amniculicola lignicola CBS 123094]
MTQILSAPSSIEFLALIFLSAVDPSSMWRWWTVSNDNTILAKAVPALQSMASKTYCLFPEQLWRPAAVVIGESITGAAAKKSEAAPFVVIYRRLPPDRIWCWILGSRNLWTCGNEGRLPEVLACFHIPPV